MIVSLLTLKVSVPDEMFNKEVYALAPLMVVTRMPSPIIDTALVIGGKSAVSVMVPAGRLIVSSVP